jgi:uroporphyrin-III C-methyltransferase
VLRYLRRSARIVQVGKRGGCASTPQAFIQRLMVAEVGRGETVVRIKGGDPFVFGRGGEEVDALRAAGIEVEVVSGLTAGIAGPAAIGVPVTDRRHAPGVALVTGHTRTGGQRPDWAALARSGLTLVVYMGVEQVEEVVRGLRDGGLGSDTPAAVVVAAHTARQRHAACTLATLAATMAHERLASPAVIVIGEVAQRAVPASVLPPVEPRPAPARPAGGCGRRTSPGEVILTAGGAAPPRRDGGGVGVGAD